MSPQPDRQPLVGTHHDACAGAMGACAVTIERLRRGVAADSAGNGRTSGS
jgi:hypothetical protein